MTPEEQYWADMEQMQQDWQRWEEDKLNKPEAKVISIAAYDIEAKVIIINEAE